MSSNAEETTAPAELPPLSGDVVPWIADPQARAAAVTVLAVRLAPQPGSNPATAAGVVQVRVDEVLGSNHLQKGQALDLPAHQVIDPTVRLHNGADHWNTLTLQPGQRWLLVVHLAAEGGRPRALAIVERSATDDSERDALQLACQLEAGVRAQKPVADGFARALSSASDIAHRYAVDAVLRRKLFGRERAAAMLAQSLPIGAVPSRRRIEVLTLALRSGIYAASLGPDETNVQILSLIAAALVHEGETALRVRWGGLLLAAVQSEMDDNAQRDAERRRQMLRSVQTPKSNDVQAVLSELIERAQGDTQARLQKLREAWRATH